MPGSAPSACCNASADCRRRWPCRPSAASAGWTGGARSSTSPWSSAAPRWGSPPGRPSRCATGWPTSVGEQRRLTLPDGSLLTLNTDSAVDLAFDASQRLVRLLRGEIFVDSRADPRPFRVATAEARLHAGATRFNVRQEMAATRVAVLAGRVELSPLHGRGRWLESGESVRLGADGEARRLAFDGLPDAWTRGMLMADRMPLAEVLAELARYRRGLLRCDPQLARLAVSGAYPLLDLRRTLGMLQATYPLKVRGVTDYWISLVPA